MPQMAACTGIGQKPGATGAAWVQGRQQALEWIRGLGSWEPSRSLELRKLLGAVVANCAEPPGTVGADWHPDVLGA